MLHLRLRHDQHLAEISQVIMGLDTRMNWHAEQIDKNKFIFFCSSIFELRTFYI